MKRAHSTGRRIRLARWLLPGLMLLTLPRLADAAQIDRAGDIRLSVRSYAAARVGTTATDRQITYDAPPRQNRIVERRLTFPYSAAGHLRQNRYFSEVELTHKLDRLVKEGFGPFSLLRSLPFTIRDIEYKLTYRGEADTIYDWGPREYSTADQFYDTTLVGTNIVFPNQPINPLKARRHLRETGTVRNRLFQAYVQGKVPIWPRGTLQLRFGRQIVAWGETDVFRLLDNINPTDPSFGGFLVPLDERRVPLDMLFADYYFGDVAGTPIADVDLQAYAAIDKSVGFYPGLPAGSPWSLPNLGAPSSNVVTQIDRPSRSFRDIRGGFRVAFSAAVPGIHTADFSLAHYYTYLDLPAVQLYTNPLFPTPVGPIVGQSPSSVAYAVQSAPLVQITGASTTFLLPLEWMRPIGISGEPTVRAELAYFHDEPRYTQRQLDPFSFATPYSDPNTGSLTPCPNGKLVDGGRLCTGGRRTGDSWNAVIGFDLQQWIRLLNDRSTFFFSTQFFYKHLNNPAKKQTITTPFPNAAPAPVKGSSGPLDGEVLPIPERYISPDWWGLPSDASEPLFVRAPTDQYLQTLLISTSYYSGRINPGLGMIYDWAGAFVLQPQISFLRDPWRFTVNFSFLTASRLRGSSGVSALRDRDNVLFQLEYAL